MTFEEIFEKILELNSAYEIHITRWSGFDTQVKKSNEYSVTVTELGHDYCVEKAYVTAKHLRTAILMTWEQLTREITDD